MRFDRHPVEALDVEFRELARPTPPPSFFNSLSTAEAGAILAVQAAALVITPWTDAPMRWALMLVASGSLWLGLRSAALRDFVRPAALMLAVLVVFTLAGCGRADPSDEAMTAQEAAALERSLQRAPRVRSEPNPAVHDFRRHHRQDATLEATEDDR